MPNSQSLTVTVRDDWPQIKLFVYAGSQLVVSDTKQYDLAMANFEVKVRNVLQQAVDRVIQSHKL